MKTGRPKKKPWELSWSTYGSHLHLIASFVDENRKRYKVRTGTRDHFKALEIATERIKSLKNTKAPTKESMTLEAAFSRMFNEVWQYQKDHRKRLNESNNILQYFGQNFLLSEVAEETLTDWESYLRGLNNSGSTINRKMAIVKATMNRAFKYWRLIDRVPVFPHHKEKKGGHKRKITEEEFEVILGCVDYTHFILFSLMYETGMRVSECLKISLDQLDVENSTIKLYDSKAGEDETVMVPRGVFMLLYEDLKEHGSITTDLSQIRTQWNKGRAKLGLMNDKQFTPGALRHTFALKLIEEGRPAPVVQAFLRHNTIITTQHYFTQTQQDLLRIRDEREES